MCGRKIQLMIRHKSCSSYIWSLLVSYTEDIEVSLLVIKKKITEINAQNSLFHH